MSREIANSNACEKEEEDEEEEEKGEGREKEEAVDSLFSSLIVYATVVC